MRILAPPRPSRRSVRWLPSGRATDMANHGVEKFSKTFAPLHLLLLSPPPPLRRFRSNIHMHILYCFIILLFIIYEAYAGDT